MTLFSIKALHFKIGLIDHFCLIKKGEPFLDNRLHSVVPSGKRPSRRTTHVHLSRLSLTHLKGLPSAYRDITKRIDLSCLKRKLRRQESRIFDC